MGIPVCFSMVVLELGLGSPEHDHIIQSILACQNILLLQGAHSQAEQANLPDKSLNTGGSDLSCQGGPTLLCGWLTLSSAADKQSIIFENSTQP